MTSPVRKAAGASDEAAVRRLSRDLQEALGQLAASAKGERAARALGLGDADAFVGDLDWDTFSFSVGGSQSATGGTALQHSLAALGPVGPAQAVLAFTTVEERAVNYAAQRAGLLIREITEQTRTVVRGLVAQSVAGDFTRRELSARIIQIVPLHSRSAQAVENTWTRTYERLIRDGSSESAARIAADRAADRQAAALLRARSEAIARTEIMTSANTGRFEGWAASIASGLDPVDSVKEWITGGNPCPECDPAHGEVVRWDEEFSTGVIMPPLHVNCRCTATLLPPSVSTQAGTGRNGDRPDYATASSEARGEGLGDPMWKARGRELGDGRYLFPDVDLAVAIRIFDSAREVAVGRQTPAEHARLRAEALGIPSEWSTR